MAKHVKKINSCKSDKIFDFIVLILLTLFLLVVAYPLYFVIISSFSDPTAVAGGDVVLLPVGFTLDGYKTVLENNEVIRSFFNSVVYTTVGTCINIAVTIPAAYSLSRKDLRGRKYIIIFFMITMYLSGGLIPTYYVVRSLGLINTMGALVIPGALSVYNMIVVMSFFRSSIPAELHESAILDGCSNTKFFFQIAVPLSSAVIAIMILFYGVGHWNSFFSGMIYLSDREKWPLQLVLRMLLIINPQQAETVKDIEELQRLRLLTQVMRYSLIIISTIPILCAYPFIQKHFIKGVMIGSIKG